MQITYDAEADALDILLHENVAAVEGVDVAPGVIAALDAAGRLVALEIIGAHAALGDAVLADSVPIEQLALGKAAPAPRVAVVCAVEMNLCRESREALPWDNPGKQMNLLFVTQSYDADSTILGVTADWVHALARRVRSVHVLAQQAGRRPPNAPANVTRPLTRQRTGSRASSPTRALARNIGACPAQRPAGRAGHGDLCPYGAALRGARGATGKTLSRAAHAVVRAGWRQP